MILAKLFKAPMKIFRKDVITFLLIRRYDLDILENKLHYIAVKQSSSLTVLRQKIWVVLELPDYCDEVIVLKSANDVEIPLTELRKGNDPGKPYFLEVWPPGKKSYPSSTRNNLLTIGNGEIQTQSNTATETIFEDEQNNLEKCQARTVVSKQTTPLNKFQPISKINFNYEKSDVSCKISSTSFFTLNRRKSRDNFINVLIKIQNDLSTLSNKLSNLETKIPV